MTYADVADAERTGLLEAKMARTRERYRAAATEIRSRGKRVTISRLAQCAGVTYATTWQYLAAHPEICDEFNISPRPTWIRREPRVSESSRALVEQAAERYREVVGILRADGMPVTVHSIAVYENKPPWHVRSFFHQHPQLAKELRIIDR